MPADAWHGQFEPGDFNEQRFERLALRAIPRRVELHVDGIAADLDDETLAKGPGVRIARDFFG